MPSTVSEFGCQCISRIAPGKISTSAAEINSDTGKSLESTTRTEPPGGGGEIALKEMVLNLLLIKRNYLEQYCSK